MSFRHFSHPIQSRAALNEMFYFLIVRERIPHFLQSGLLTRTERLPFPAVAVAVRELIGNFDHVFLRRFKRHCPFRHHYPLTAFTAFLRLLIPPTSAIACFCLSTITAGFAPALAFAISLLTSALISSSWCCERLPVAAFLKKSEMESKTLTPLFQQRLQSDSL